MKKIAFIVSHTKHSPQWEWFLNEIKRDIEIHFLIIDEDKNNILYQNLKTHGINNVHIIISRNIFEHIITLFYLIFYLIINNINIVQTEMPLGNLLGITASLLTFRKRIMTASNVTWFKDFNSKKQLFIDKFSYIFSNIIICQAKSSKEILQNEFKVPTKKIRIINHALKFDVFSSFDEQEIALLKKKYSIRKNDFIIGMVARLEQWKGHYYTIKALKLIVDKYPNTKLLIFGEGPEKENLSKLISDLHLKEHVVLCGFEKNSISLYKIFDIQIHVPVDPYCETFGITIIDAMMSKVPLIVTLSGIAKEIASHLHNAWVVPFKDEKAIAHAIITMINSPELRNKLGQNAQKTILNNFSITTKVQKHIEVYNQLINCNKQ